MFRAFLAAFLVAAVFVGSRSSSPQTGNPQALPPGALLPRVVTLQNPQQSYAL